MTAIKALRLLIREEISKRSQSTGQKIDAYPWVTPDEKVSIFSNSHDKTAIAVVSSEDESVQKKLPSDEEAKFWAASEVDKRRRKRFSSQK